MSRVLIVVAIALAILMVAGQEAGRRACLDRGGQPQAQFGGYVCYAPGVLR